MKFKSTINPLRNIPFTAQVLVIDDYPYHQELRDELLPTLKQYRDVQNHGTNVKATMTEWSIVTPQIKNLQEFIVNYIRAYPSPFLSGGDHTLVFDSFWGNVYRKGDYTLRHNHNGGEIQIAFNYFLNSRIYYPSLVFESFGIGGRVTRKKILPKEGRLVIFPSYLIHKVNKHRYKNERITLAGNIVARRTYT